MFLEADIAYEIVAALALHGCERKDFPAFGIDFLQARENRRRVVLCGWLLLGNPRDRAPTQKITAIAAKVSTLGMLQRLGV